MPVGHDDRESSGVVVSLPSAGAGAAAAAAACFDDIALKVLRIGARDITERWPRAVALCKQFLQIIVPTYGVLGRVEDGYGAMVAVLKVQAQKFLGRQVTSRLGLGLGLQCFGSMQTAGEINHGHITCIPQFYHDLDSLVGFCLQKGLLCLHSAV